MYDVIINACYNKKYEVKDILKLLLIVYYNPFFFVFEIVHTYTKYVK